MTIASIFKDTAANGSLMKLIEDTFVSERVKTPLTLSDSIRASSVPSLCAREEVICALNGIDRLDRVDAGLNLTFLHGTSLHWGVQNKLLGPAGILYGTWRCDSCGQMHGIPRDGVPIVDWAVRYPNECSRCGDKVFTYEEHSFADPSIQLTGHSDGFLVVPGLPGMGILEVKSIGARGALEIKNAPQIGHLIQAHVYMMFSGLQWAKILYWKKADYGVKALVEHHVVRDEDTVSLIRETVGSVWSGIRDKTLPQRICATDHCPRAKSCPVVDRCFHA